MGAATPPYGGASTLAEPFREDLLSELSGCRCMVNFVDLKKIQQRSVDADGCC